MFKEMSADTASRGYKGGVRHAFAVCPSRRWANVTPKSNVSLGLSCIVAVANTISSSSMVSSKGYASLRCIITIGYTSHITTTIFNYISTLIRYSDRSLASVNRQVSYI